MYGLGVTCVAADDSGSRFTWSDRAVSPISIIFFISHSFTVLDKLLPALSTVKQFDRFAL